MKGYTQRFNLFLALGVLLLALVAGCSTMSALGLKKDEPLGSLRVHIELSPSNAALSSESAENVTVLRADPVKVTIDKDPVLTENNLVAAKVIATPEAQAIEVRFDENGTWILEQYSAANPGRHFVIYAQWGKDMKDGRWIAAPLITKRISDGILSFTPDMSTNETDQLITGLNNIIKQFQTTSQSSQ
jgi:preprotein translocase subunit SecD